MKEYFNNFNCEIKNDVYKYLGSFLKKNSAVFRVWAQNATSVSVVGDFNDWDSSRNVMENIGNGIWQTEISGIKNFDTYKYAVTGTDGRTVLKSDPYARHFETSPATASKVYKETKFKWTDEEWLKEREKKNNRCDRLYGRAYG